MDISGYICLVFLFTNPCLGQNLGSPNLALPTPPDDLLAFIDSAVTTIEWLNKTLLGRDVNGAEVCSVIMPQRGDGVGRKEEGKGTK